MLGQIPLPRKVHTERMTLHSLLPTSPTAYDQHHTPFSCRHATYTQDLHLQEFQRAQLPSCTGRQHLWCLTQPLAPGYVWQRLRQLLQPLSRGQPRYASLAIIALLRLPAEISWRPGPCCAGEALHCYRQAHCWRWVTGVACSQTWPSGQMPDEGLSETVHVPDEGPCERTLQAANSMPTGCSAYLITLPFIRPAACQLTAPQMVAALGVATSAGGQHRSCASYLSRLARDQRPFKSRVVFCRDSRHLLDTAAQRGAQVACRWRTGCAALQTRPATVSLSLVSETVTDRARCGAAAGGVGSSLHAYFCGLCGSSPVK